MSATRVRNGIRQRVKAEEKPGLAASDSRGQQSRRTRLVSEVGELTESMEILNQKLEEAEQCLRNLEDTRMSLEKDIANKANTLFIDREKCMTHRTRYPSVIKLSGY